MKVVPTVTPEVIEQLSKMDIGPFGSVPNQLLTLNHITMVCVNNGGFVQWYFTGDTLPEKCQFVGTCRLWFRGSFPHDSESWAWREADDAAMMTWYESYRAGHDDGSLN